MLPVDLQLTLKDTFRTELPADESTENRPRQVEGACFSYVTPIKTAAPTLLHYSMEVAALIGLNQEAVTSDHFLKIFTGNALLEGSRPYAMCYGGHQFGNWAGQLGDGRAINLAEVQYQGKNWALQLKGAGPTPYSRRADGLAVLRSSIREYLCSEAMYHLGVPTTRALSLALTGDQVLRDMLYDGNAAYEKGAIVCRVAPSFIRFGNFEIFAARKDYTNLRKLVDYTIKHFYSHLGQPSKEAYLAFFKKIAEKTLKMVVHWQRVGFVHGVMNTDNFSILGLTIDYGPYGWLEGYEHGWTPNTTDRHQKRYRFENQPDVSLWNLLKLANALYPLIEEVAPLETILKQFKSNYVVAYRQMMQQKLGLEKDFEEDEQLIQQLEEALHLTETDMTIFFRNLADFQKETLIDDDFLQLVYASFYKPEELTDSVRTYWQNWFKNYQRRLQLETWSDSERKVKMNAVNPKYVLRNYMAQMAIDDADEGKYELIDELFQLLKQPYAEQPDMEKWFAKRPEWARHKVGCSMLSCSS
ncbi:MAG: YdiU family protein [Bacteroidota bacterium]